MVEPQSLLLDCGILWNSLAILIDSQSEAARLPTPQRYTPVLESLQGWSELSNI